ncbi:MAG: bifunctional adenosylcobinamide kinase/adenosylcobinamide-phosphate guanylyltransferase [Thermoflexales bacterium]|nr:bifunctional adenosylcobinamide kinase/adenosylcobinamide-phosphate guanylyltransferase [Thermoflexales bacterium]MDW8351114.1 bifunctional adenosylcobinamide kinase/adenosylcobinamide-phosphate guanylyltransferase [Anaerolineae bacterium]
MHLTFVIGGARSGKSAFAQDMARIRGGDAVCFVATLREDIADAEMQRRIQRHRANRPATWPTVALGDHWREQLRAIGNPRVILLDCLSLFVSGALFLGNDPSANAEDAAAALVDDLLTIMRGSTANWIVVSNEVGMATVPEHPVARAYRDALGRANQIVMRAADEAYLLIAGAPLRVR